MEQILDVGYWKERLSIADAKGEIHQAVFRCPLTTWLKIEAKHREILKQHVRDYHSVLDAGCGWGRLLTLLPLEWRGRYLGVDLSPDFVERAQLHYPDREFVVGDLRNLTFPDRFDWAILISIRPMIKRNLGDEAWAEMEREIKRRASKTLYLEYDEKCEGFVE